MIPLYGLGSLERLALFDAIGRERRATFTRGDPYRRNRKAPRNLRYFDRDRGVWVQPTGRRAVHKLFWRNMVANRVEAQQEIESWLRRRGVRWHQLARVIAREYRGDWNRIEDALVRWGHVKREQETAQ